MAPRIPSAALRPLRALRLALLVALVPLAAATAAGRAARPALYFDLGDALLATPVDAATGEIARVSWMRYRGPAGTTTDARAYLAELSRQGYPIGLLVNIPQEWGDPGLVQARAWLAETDPARRAALAADLTARKIATIDAYFEGKGPDDPPGTSRRWGDPDHPRMDWDVFTAGHVLVPFFDENRKPDHGPLTSDDQLFLFQQALSLAQRAGVPAIFQGENAGEIDAARRVGMLVHLLPFQRTPVQGTDFYLDAAAIDRLVAGTPR